MDGVATEYVRKHGTSFRQHGSKVRAILDGEYDLTRTVMGAGFVIDTLQLAYQGMNWTDRRNWGCNGNVHPSREKSYFGISLNPLEVIFHKVYWEVQERVAGPMVDLYMAWSLREANP